jgi:alpha-beta hydrolase superfamily lysophospholipase
LLWTASLILRAIYIALPAASLGAYAFKDKPALKRTVAGAWISGTILAAAVLAAYVMATGGSVAYTQMALAIYFGVSLMLFLKVVDHVLRRVFVRLFRLDKPGLSRSRVAAALLVRVVVFATFALPWVMSAVMVYRPRVVPIETPQSIMRLDYQTVAFDSPDGRRIEGWLIRSQTSSSTTAIVCHGLGASKASMWSILRGLHDANVNVIAIDLRAHGGSSGQLSSFGASEWQDVIGAVDYLKREHSDDADRIAAIGSSLGAAAIIKAAARDDRIDAVAILGTFDSLPTLARDLSREHMVFPLNLMTRYLALPMASLHTGHDLFGVNPGDAIGEIWPRPVLIIHGGNDEIIPFDHGKRLYDRSFEPREKKFTGGTHNGVADDPDVVDAIIHFVLTAESRAVI